MREILYRGRTLGAGVWVFGYYVAAKSRYTGQVEHLIQTIKENGEMEYLCKVDPKTVGQYIGRPDDYNVRIFEGDVLKLKNGGYTDIVRVEYFKGKTGFVFIDEKGRRWSPRELSDIATKVIGNIHDNPELIRLEGKTENRKEKGMKTITTEKEMIAAGEKQEINLEEVEATLLLQYMDRHDYALEMNALGGTERHNFRTHETEGVCTILEAVEFCILQIENSIKETENAPSVNFNYLTELRKDKLVLEGILQKSKKDSSGPQRLCRETPMGTIVVNANTDKEHPGIWIDLHRPNLPDEDDDMPIAVVEVCSDEGDLPEGENRLITRVWRDAKDESYTDRIVHEGVDEYFAEGERCRMEKAAKDFVTAIKEIASKPDNLANLESYLTFHFPAWLEKHANTPEGLVSELKTFCKMEM